MRKIVPPSWIYGVVSIILGIVTACGVFASDFKEEDTYQVMSMILIVGGLIMIGISREASR